MSPRLYRYCESSEHQVQYNTEDTSKHSLATIGINSGGFTATSPHITWWLLLQHIPVWFYCWTKVCWKRCYMKKMLYEKRHVNDLVNYLSIHYPGIFIVICIRMTLFGIRWLPNFHWQEIGAYKTYVSANVATLRRFWQLLSSSAQSKRSSPSFFSFWLAVSWCQTIW